MTALLIIVGVTLFVGAVLWLGTGVRRRYVALGWRDHAMNDADLPESPMRGLEVPRSMPSMLSESERQSLDSATNNFGGARD
jgi:hypothetical protein